MPDQVEELKLDMPDQVEELKPVMPDQVKELKPVMPDQVEELKPVMPDQCRYNVTDGTCSTRITKGNNYKGPGPTAPIFFPTIQLVILVMCTNFKILGIVVLKKSLTQNKC